MVSEDAERAAEGVLKANWSADLQSCPLPVDPVRIAKSLALAVYAVDLPDRELAGMLVKKANFEPVIYLNANDHPNRQRFTCAHEIGHYVDRATRDSDAWEFIDNRSTLSSRGVDPAEIFANRFAAALLMPRAAVLGLKDVYGKSGLAGLFQVSVEAMGHRLTNLQADR